MNIEQGLDFILEHFQEPIFPRLLSTRLTGGPIQAFSKEDALQHFKNADLFDCKISAFSKHETDNVIPNLILIDTDKPETLDEILFIFGRELRAKPLVLSDGHNFTVIQPIKAGSWKNVIQHGKNGMELANLFMHFTNRYLSNNKCSLTNDGYLNKFFITIPASINSHTTNETEIQTFWDGKRIDVSSLRFYDFIEELTHRKHTELVSDYDYVETLLKKSLILAS